MRFLDPIDVRVLQQTDGGRLTYALKSDFRYRSDVLGRVLTVPAGFVTDFESIPLVLVAFTGPPCPWAGLPHDWLYQSHDCADRAQADAVYREALAAAGVPDEYAVNRYAAVSFYGGDAWASGPSRLRIVPTA